MPRLWLAALGAAALLACGDDSSGGGPNQNFPDVEGTYVVTGSFDGIAENRASFAGTVTIVQESLESSILSGTASLTITDSTRTLSISGVELEDAGVSLAGVVAFTVPSPTQNVTWDFTGERAGDVLEGDHTLVEGGTTHTGTWSGER